MVAASRRLVDPYGRPLVSSERQRRFRAARQLMARHDASITNDDNRRHWANADGLSPAAAASPERRAILRNRARYECQESNSYAKGIVLTLANDTISTGPRLQVMTKDRDANRRIEQAFNRWARAAKLSRKLWTMKLSKTVDGETFALQKENERLPTPVKLDLSLVEADQISTPTLTWRPNEIDGIRYDENENPVEYHLLKAHPGADRGIPGSFTHYDPIAARHVIHWFREDRPGQRRGFPEVTAALPLFALLRRFTLATIAAAETAAEFAGVMFTDSPANEDPADVEAMDAIELEMRAMLTLPAGWKMGQVKAEHPSTTYEMFRNAILNEIARCVNMPFNKASGNSAGYNFASGRLDHQTYFEAIDVERADCEIEVLDPILMWWLDEAGLIEDLLPGGLGPLGDLPHTWRWPAHRHVDPLKEANAAATLWERGLLTDDEYLLGEGVDPEEHYQQLEEQLDRRRRLGLPVPGEKERDPAPVDTTDNAEEDS